MYRDRKICGDVREVERIGTQTRVEYRGAQRTNDRVSARTGNNILDAADTTCAGRRSGEPRATDIESRTRPERLDRVGFPDQRAGRSGE